MSQGEDRGIIRAALAGLFAIIIIMAAPLVLATGEAGWKLIVMLSLVLACFLLAVAAAVLALVSSISERKGSLSTDRLTTLADIFLIATIGAMAVTAIFAFVFTLLQMA